MRSGDFFIPYITHSVPLRHGQSCSGRKFSNQPQAMQDMKKIDLTAAQHGHAPAAPAGYYNDA